MSEAAKPEEDCVRERRRNYELMIVISPLQANEEGVASVIDRISKSIVANGGEVSAVNQSAPWGRRKLAYPIREYAGGEASRRNFTEGYYVLLHFGLSAAKVIEIERTLKLTDPVIRYLFTLVEQKGTPSTSVEAAAERDEVELVEEGE